MVTKKTLGIIGASTLLVGGVSAYILLDKTPKEAYLYAEYKTGKEMIEFFADRYEEELAWAEKTSKNPSKNEFELSANIEDYNYNLSSELVDAINSSSINLVMESDPKEKQIAMGVGATILDYDVDNFTFYITDESSMLELPFQDEALKVGHQDLVDIIEDMAGESICLKGEDLANILTNQSVLEEDDLEYLQKEYGKLLMDILPDEAFTRNDDTITMELSGKDLENIIEEFANFAENDRELIRILKEVVHYSDPCSEIDFEEELKLLFDGLKDLDIDGELISKIWIEKNIITKRTIEVGGLEIKAKQSIDENLVFDYEFKDDYYGSLFTVEGKFTSGERIKDSLTIENSDVVLTYESNERIDKDTRKFEREFYYNDYYSEFALNWDGDYSVSGDKMSGEHNIYMEIPGEGKVGLAVKNTNVITKKINLPKNTVDIGKMTTSEIEEYLEYEIAPNAQKWGEGLFKELEDILYYY